MRKSFKCIRPSPTRTNLRVRGHHGNHALSNGSSQRAGQVHNCPIQQLRGLPSTPRRRLPQRNRLVSSALSPRNPRRCLFRDCLPPGPAWIPGRPTRLRHLRHSPHFHFLPAMAQREECPGRVSRRLVPRIRIRSLLTSPAADRDARAKQTARSRNLHILYRFCSLGLLAADRRK